MASHPFCVADRCGFPMIWVEEIGAYIHWLPVTKVQFEYFLCEVSDPQFDAQWYKEVLELNGRVSPGAVRADNYWQALISGVLPGEARRFARWCGPEYDLPTRDEWLSCYHVLSKRAPLNLSEILGLPGLNERARVLVEKLDQAPQAALDKLGHQRMRAEQILLRLGVLEWVVCPGAADQWGVLGELNPGFRSLLFSPDNGEARRPRDPETLRSANHGFRLKRTPL